MTNVTLTQNFYANWSYLTVDVKRMNMNNAFGYANPLAAGFTANVTYGHPYEAVLFTDTSAGSPTKWNWTFGDGTYSELQNPTHAYAYGSNFNVTLNALTQDGSNATTKTEYIHIDPLSTDPIRVISPERWCLHRRNLP